MDHFTGAYDPVRDMRAMALSDFHRPRYGYAVIVMTIGLLAILTLA